MIYELGDFHFDFNCLTISLNIRINDKQGRCWWQWSVGIHTNDEARIMRLNCFFILAVLLFGKNCSSKVTQQELNSEAVDLSEGNHYNDNINYYQASKPLTNFLELNKDMLYLIFNHLSLVDLSNLVTFNDGLASVVSDVLRQMYRNYMLSIIWAEDEPRTKFTQDTTSSSLNIYDYKLGINLLKFCANAFDHLNICIRDMERNHSIVINRYANKYFSECSTYLNVDIMDDTLD